MEKNYKHFEDTEENKFIYSDIHKEYVSVHFCFLFFGIFSLSSLHLL